jgi:hypothetical protein
MRLEGDTEPHMPSVDEIGLGDKQLDSVGALLVRDEIFVLGVLEHFPQGLALVLGCEKFCALRLNGCEQHQRLVKMLTSADLNTMDSRGQEPDCGTQLSRTSQRLLWAHILRNRLSA